MICSSKDPVSDETDLELKPSEGSLADGMRIIGEFVRTLPRKPGVYRMIAADGEVLYVRKARSLRSRVAPYTQPPRPAPPPPPPAPGPPPPHLPPPHRPPPPPPPPPP